MRVRLRDAYSPEKLAEIYAAPHNHSKWHDHQVRVAVTIQIAHALSGAVESGADLSCGDATILNALHVQRRHLGDFAPGHEYTGPLEQTLELIPRVDLYICTETLEHVDDPELVLRAIRSKARDLVLSTPVDNWGDRNPEHYWSWSRSDVEELLISVGFQIALYNELDLRPGGGEYAFGIWGCR
jgi:hypothetical protein